MMEEELITIWQSSPNQERVKFEKSRLMIDVQSSLDQLHRRIKFRDLSELVGVIIVVPVFAIYAFRLPHLLSKIACVLNIIWACYVLIRLRNARKHKPSAFTESYLEYLHKTKDYLHIQVRLIESAFYWYLLPVFVIVNLFMAGFIGTPGKLPGMIRLEAFGVIGSVFIYLRNKRVIKNQYIPRLNKIDELIALMERR